MNTEILNDGTEIYSNKLMQLADDYIDKRFEGNIENFKSKYFPDLLNYIYDRTPTPENDDLNAMNTLFDNYVRLCCRYGILPTLSQFAILSGNAPSTFTDWLNGAYRAKSPEYSQSVKRWKGICQSMVEGRLHNEPGTSANLIFTAKACYGYCETAPQVIPQTKTREQLSAEQAIQDFKKWQAEQRLLEQQE